MRGTIDGGGRIAIPKEVRTRLNLVPGTPVDIEERDGWLEIVPAPAALTVVTATDGVLVAQPQEQLPTLSADQVRAVTDQARR